MGQRIYLVNGEIGATVEPRLIKASTKQQAVSFAAQSLLSAKVASQDDLVQALSNGIKVETYGETEAE